MALFGMSKQEVVESLTAAMKASILELDENKRYMLIISTEDEEVIKSFIVEAKRILDLENSNLRIMFVSNPNIKLMEF